MAAPVVQCRCLKGPKGSSCADRKSVSSGVPWRGLVTRGAVSGVDSGCCLNLTIRLASSDELAIASMQLFIQTDLSTANAMEIL